MGRKKDLLADECIVGVRAKDLDSDEDSEEVDAADAIGKSKPAIPTLSIPAKTADSDDEDPNLGKHDSTELDKQNEEEEEHAALKIQCLYRQKKAREQVRKITEAKASGVAGDDTSKLTKTSTSKKN